MGQVFILEAERSHVNDSGYDAFHLPFPEDRRISSRMMGIREFPLPEEIYFQGDFRILKEIDMPVNDLGLTIVSDKMLKVILECGLLKYRKLPAIMLDDQYPHKVFDGNKLKEDVKRINNFSAIQLMEYTDAFDYEHSQYEMSIAFPNDVGVIHKLSLKNIDSIKSPVFKLKECPEHVFLSEKTKEALGNNCIKGCLFKSLSSR